METNFSKLNPKRILGYLMAMFVMVFFSMSANAQCFNTSAYGSATASATSTVTISTCNYLSEVSTVSGVTAGTSYTADCQMGGSSVGYITVTEGSATGTVLAHGSAPLTFTAAVAGAHYLHWTVNDTCLTASGCHTTTITGNTVVVPGCTDPLATNYNPAANVDDGSCTYPAASCGSGIGANTDGFESATANFQQGPWVHWELNASTNTFTGTNAWRSLSGGTGSGGTGPTGPAEGTYYIYCETSGQYGKRADLESECVDISQIANPALVFSYHMLGAAMGDMYCIVSTDSGANWTDTLWSALGDQGGQWNDAVIDLSAYANDIIRVRMNYTSGTSFTGDAALDNMRFMVMPVPGCMDPFASNYNSAATIDDGSCLYVGCTDPFAMNYCATCNVSDSASCVYPSCSAAPITEDFESFNLSTNQWVVGSGSEAIVALTTANAIADTVSLEMSGATSALWGATPYNEAAAYDTATKGEHFGFANICVDLSGTTAPEMNALIGMPGYYTAPYRWLRVLVNGSVIMDTDSNTSMTNATASVTGAVRTGIPAGGETVTWDLTPWAGQSNVTITFQSSCKYGPTYSTVYNDLVEIDNINIYNVVPCTYYSADATTTNVQCTGDSTGTATITVNNGWGTDSYAWSNGQTGATATGLPAGTYTCVVTDATNGCSDTVSATVTEPSNIAISGLVVDATTPLATDGAIDLTVTGGSPCETSDSVVVGTHTSLYTGFARGYWFQAQSSFTITGLRGSAGSGQTGTLQSVGIMEMTSAPAYTLTLGATTNSGPEWSACMVPAGGAWASIPGGFPVTAGNWYIVMGSVHDASGTGFTHQNSYGLPGQVVLDGIPTDIFRAGLQGHMNDVSCVMSDNVWGTTSGSIGRIDIQTGVIGAQAYSYAWSTGDTTEDISNLGMGPYSVTVTDCNGCSASWSGFVMVSQVPGCTDPNASNYNPQANFDDGSCLYPGCTDTLATNFDSSANVLDSSCVYDCSITLDTLGMISCYGQTDGLLSVNAGNASVSWSTGATGNSISGLAAGSYTAYASISNGLSGCSDSLSFTIVEPDTMSLSAFIVDESAPSASDGSIDLTVSGGTISCAQDSVLAGSHTSSYTSSFTRGYWFQAQSNFVVTGMMAATDGNAAAATATEQSVAIVDYGTVAPTAAFALPSSVVHYGSYAEYGAPANQMINIPGGFACVAGNYYGVIGYAYDAGSSTGYNSYATPAPIVDIAGMPTQLSRLGIQGSITAYSGNTLPTNTTWGTALAGGPIGRIHLVTGTPGAQAYSYAWSSGDTTEDLSGVTAGTYSVTVTDCNGCSASGTYSVITSATPGCMDTLASNYNPAANVDDGSCLYPGCTDSLATNYNSTANIDDSSCVYSCAYYGLPEVNIDFFSGSFASECSWDIVDSAGNILAAGGPYSTNNTNYVTTECLAYGCYTVNMYDSFGDGWNGAEISIVDPFSGYVYGNGTFTTGTAGSFVFCFDPCASYVIVVDSTSNPSCNGLSDGSINISVPSSTTSVSWSNGATGTSLSGLAAGSYVATATNGTCTAVDTVVITDPSVISASMAVVNSATGGNDGSIDLTVTGGTPCITSVDLAGPLPGGNGQAGNAFNITNNTASPMLITGLSQGPGSGNTPQSNVSTEVYYYAGDYTTNMTNITTSALGGWVLCGSGTVNLTPSAATGYVAVSGVSIPAGATYGFYIESSVTVQYTNGTGTPGSSVWFSDANISVSEGHGVYGASTTGIFNFAFSPRNWNGTVHYGDPAAQAYTYAWSNGATTEDLDSVAPGVYCVTITDCNGCVSASFCDTITTSVIAGCTNPNALNYNPAANVDDGSCILPVPGCTDSTALNYNPAANVDDGSCFACSGLVTAPFTETFDVLGNLGPFTDAFGAGSGSSVAATLAWTQDAAGTPSSGTGPSDDVTGGGYYMFTETSGGGSNKTAVLFSACVDATSLPSACLSFSYHMYGATQGTLEVRVNGDSAWSASGNLGNQWINAQVDVSAWASGNMLIEFVGLTGTSFTSDMAIDKVSVGACQVAGCTDSTAYNYNPAATLDDGSCVWQGCTDPLATNYCATCTVPDSASCTYPSCNNVPFTEDWESNSFVSGNWLTSAGAEAGVSIDTAMTGLSVAFTGGNYLGWTGGSSTTTSAQAWANTDHLSSAFMCVDLSAYTSTDYVSMTLDYNSLSYFGNGAYSWFRVSVDGTVLADINGNLDHYLPGLLNLEYDLSAYNGNSSVTVTLEAACKYDVNYSSGIYADFVWVDNINISQSTPAVFGCTDPLYANYNPAATTDDGSCAGCTANTAVVEMIDSYGDGWNGATYTLSTGGAAVATGTLSSGSYGADTLCLATGCYDIVVTGGSYPSEVSFNFGSVVGGTPGTYTDISVGGAQCGLGGCTDTAALNYNPAANWDDGSCVYCVYGCTDSTAFNFNPSATCNDGSCIAIIYGCTDSTAFNYYPGANTDDGSCCFVAGCTDPLATNYDSTACIDNGTCTYCVYGCTDPLATNYNPSATCDDGSCIVPTGCSEPIPTGIYSYDIIDERAKIAWDNMNLVDTSCKVNIYRIRYRESGTSAWSSKTMQGSGLCIFGLNTTVKQMLNLTHSTTYEYKMKAWYCGGAANGTGWSATQTFTTQGICPDITNLTVTPNPNNNTRATFCWDTTGTYLYARVKYRVDTSGSSWINVGGFGVYYPTTCKVKFGMTPGENYKATGRAFCDPNMSAYNSNWTPFITWTQPGSIRVDGGTTINNLDVYPNPSRDIFNVSFTSEDVQDLEIRVINVVGEVVYTEDLQQFVGEYTKAVDLEEFTKGIYFLEITTNSGVVNKKLILQ
jgi:hypothetical protein